MGTTSVRIDTPDLDPSEQLIELPDQVLDASQLIANSCLVPSSQRQGTFVVTGSGGLPTLPTTPARSPFPTYDLPSTLPTAENPPPLPPEPTGFYPLEDGRVVLSRLCSGK